MTPDDSGHEIASGTSALLQGDPSLADDDHSLLGSSLLASELESKLYSDPSIDKQRQFYDGWNTRWRNETLAEIEPEIRVRAERGAALLREAGIRHPAKLLEVGCGTGWAAEIFSELGELTGIDLSPAAIELARKRKSQAKFMAGDFVADSFEMAHFDTIIAIETLFYVPDQTLFVARIAELLKPGGLVLISTINKWVYERSGDVSPPEPGQVRNWLSIRETRKLFESDFRLLHFETLAPRGRDGILRFINAKRLDSALASFGLAGHAQRLKERMRLGGGVLYLFSKRN